MKLGLGGGERCRICDKRVYFAERVHSYGFDYHKTCFKCVSCDKRLNPGQNLTHDNEPYCQTCYTAAFGPEGYRSGAAVIQKKSFRPMLHKASSSATLLKDNEFKPKVVKTQNGYRADFVRGSDVNSLISENEEGGEQVGGVRGPLKSFVEVEIEQEREKEVKDFGVKEDVKGKNGSNGKNNSQEEEVREVYKYNFLQVLDIVKRIRPNNLTARYLTKDLFLSYSRKEQDLLFHICISGLEHYKTDEENIGCFALTPTDYETFSAFFNPVIEAYFKCKINSSSSFNFSEAFPSCLDILEGGLNSSKLKKVSVEVSRNFEEFNLPGSLSKFERLTLEAKLFKTFSKFEGKIFSFTPESEHFWPEDSADENAFDAIDANAKFLANKFLKSAGFHEDFPVGRGIFVSSVDADTKVSVFYNYLDHIKIVISATASESGDVKLSNVSDMLQKFEEEIANEGLNYAQSEKVGFVTSQVNDLGLGLKVKINAGKSSKEEITLKADLNPAAAGKKFQDVLAKVIEGL